MDNFANAPLLFSIKFLLTVGNGYVSPLVLGLIRITRRYLRQRNCVSHCLLLAPTGGGALFKCTHPAVSLSDTDLSWEVLRAGTSLLSSLLCTPIIMLHWGIKRLFCSWGFGGNFGEFTWEIWC